MSGLHHIGSDSFPQNLGHSSETFGLPSSFDPNHGSQDNGDFFNVLLPLQYEPMRVMAPPMLEYRSSQAGAAECNVAILDCTGSNFSLSAVAFDAGYPGLDRSF